MEPRRDWQHARAVCERKLQEVALCAVSAISVLSELETLEREEIDGIISVRLLRGGGVLARQTLLSDFWNLYFD